MLSNEFLAMQLTRLRQEELSNKHRNDNLLRYLIREYKSQLHDNNRNKNK